MVMIGGTFVRGLGHDDGALMKGISALIKEAPVALASVARLAEHLPMH